jgi:CBS domain-containing protein
MGRVTDILDVKQRDVLTIGPQSTVFEAIRSMVEANVGSVIVADGDSIHGIFTERDYLRRIILQDRSSKTTPVADVMTSKVVCVEPDSSIEDCMVLVTQQRIRHLPVVEDGRLVGIVSIGDLVKFLSMEREIEIRYLTDYIAGKYPG